MPDRGPIPLGPWSGRGAQAVAPAGSAAWTWITLFTRIRARDLRGTPLSPAMISGMAAAYQMTAALFRAGAAKLWCRSPAAGIGGEPGRFSGFSPTFYPLRGRRGPRQIPPCETGVVASAIPPALGPA